MKGKSRLGVLSVIGILALSVTAAQAGGADGAAFFNTFFACQAHNADERG